MWRSWFALVVCSWIVAVCSPGARATSIDCSQTGKTIIEDSICKVNEPCTVHCKQSCHDDSGAQLFGTVYYATTSSICKSALHDLRMSSWNASARTATVVITGEGDVRRDITGSVRYGVSSKDWFTSTPYFYFTSPRIYEEPLDVTMLERNLIYGDSSTPSQMCYGPTGHKITFDYSIKEIDLNVPVDLAPPLTEGYYNLTWPRGVYPHIRTNVFWCRVHNAMVSDIAVPAMYFGNPRPPFLPRRYTVTASLGERLEVGVDLLEGTEKDITSWEKVNGWNGKDHSKLSSPGAKLSVNRTQIHNGGVYIVNGPHTGSPGRNRALFRVIVRMCPDNVYGPLCENRCPRCENGGVCHDITGRCVCPPGFKGKRCEQQCGEDRFGRECQHRCSGTNSKDVEEKSCRGVLICLPDPYGCSCGTGFAGYFCNETCPEHYYGADCRQHRNCFCKQKGTTCDVFTGTCIADGGACLDGWKNGPYCDISYPLLNDGPMLTDVRDTSVEVTWNAWERGKDIGEGNPRDYLLLYKLAEEDRWTTVVVPSVRDRQRYTHRVTGLRESTFYDVKIFVRDSDAKYRERGAKERRFRTHCGQPTAMPSNVKTDDSNSRSVVITWENPPPATWKCYSANVTIMYNDSRATFNLSHPAGDGRVVTRFRFATEPFTVWKIKLRIETPDGEPGLWTPVRTAVSAQDAPTEVREVTVARVEDRRAQLRWQPPEKRNGILRVYEVSYQMLHLLDPGCKTVPKGPLLSRNVTDGTEGIDLMSLRPSAEYIVSIRAFTVKPGNETTLRFQTKAAVPAGVVADLKATVHKAYTKVQWSRVPCSVANGEITAYHTQLLSLDPWDTEFLKDTTRDTSVVYNKLTPYTRYEFRVSAENGAGKSDLSANTNFRTPPSKPEAPTELVAAQQSQTNVSLTWIAPYPPNGILENYEIQYWTGTEEMMRRTAGANETRCAKNGDFGRQCYTISNLRPLVVYHFRVVAKNVGTEQGPSSKEIEVETKELPPQPPTDLRAEKSTENSISVSWKEPLQKNGILREYRLNTTLVHSYDVELLGSSRPRSAFLKDTSVQKYTLKLLFPGSTYYVCVEASTSAGFGNATCATLTTKASVPVVEKGPSLDTIVNNTVRVVLAPVDFQKGPITNYYVLVVRGYGDVQGPLTPTNFTESVERELPFYTAARISPEELQRTTNFTVGAGTVVGGFYNAPLEPTTPYRFGLLVESNFSGDVTYGYRFSEPIVIRGEDGAGGIATAVSVVLILLALVVIVILGAIYYNRRKRDVPYRNNKPAGSSLREKLSRISKMDDGSVSESRMTLNMDNGDCVGMVAVHTNGVAASAVQVKELPTFVVNSLENGKLSEEYMMAGRGQLHPWEIAKRPENKQKNRYGNILPYDHSRVVLSRISDPDSDYINASYVPGYKSTRRYIATQGPKPVTVADFWRMIWEEGSCKIVMLTNPKEQDKVKCEKYWPDAVQKYGQVVVTLEKIETQVDFVVRQFTVSQAQEEASRQVVQFHFTTWPDHGVPIYPDAMYPFMKRVRAFKHKDPNPIVVHCSGGIGRTGTFILVDSMMDQSEAEGQVNPAVQLLAMRQSRVNMVESLDQYVFAHRALVEILCSKNHKMSVKEFMERYHKLRVRSPDTGKSVTEDEFEELGKSCLAYDSSCESALHSKNVEKNRSKSILAGDSRRFFLSVPGGSGRTDYINAVYVDGFKKRNAFLVTQFPLPDTVGDFWQMVVTSNARTIVTLDRLESDSRDCPQFWPEAGTSRKYYGSAVEVADVKEQSGVISRTFRVEQPGTAPRMVRQFHLQEWPQSSTVPPSCDIILDLLQQVERWQMRTDSRLLLVQCLDGCRASGLFCATAILREQIKTDQELDVFRCVQTVRGSRPQFIVDQEQYDLCYDVALSFLDTFDTYSNFQ